MVKAGLSILGYTSKVNRKFPVNSTAGNFVYSGMPKLSPADDQSRRQLIDIAADMIDKLVRMLEHGNPLSDIDASDIRQVAQNLRRYV